MLTIDCSRAPKSANTAEIFAGEHQAVICRSKRRSERFEIAHRSEKSPPSPPGDKCKTEMSRPKNRCELQLRYPAGGNKMASSGRKRSESRKPHTGHGRKTEKSG